MHGTTARFGSLQRQNPGESVFDGEGAASMPIGPAPESSNACHSRAVVRQEVLGGAGRPFSGRLIYRRVQNVKVV